MKTKEDEIARSHRIANELRALQQIKREQDRDVDALTSTRSAWEIANAQVPEEIRALFVADASTSTSTAEAPRVRSAFALRG